MNTGTYQCLVCERMWDATEVRGRNHGCGDAMCSAHTKKISNLPKEEYLKTLNTTLNTGANT